MNKYYLINFICLFFAIDSLIINQRVIAQTPNNTSNNSSSAPSTTTSSKKSKVKLPEYELSPDSLKLYLNSKGLQKTLSEIYMRHMNEQISMVEIDYIKYGYVQNAVRTLVDSVILVYPNESASNVVELSLGKTMELREVNKPTGRFDGALSPAVEKSLLDLQWSSKNRQPLQSLKSKFGDLDRDLEQILTNEANENKLVEELFRKSIYERAKKHIEGRMRFVLNDNDKLAATIGKRVEDELLNNLKVSLSKKSLVELTEMMNIVEKYFD